MPKKIDGKTENWENRKLGAELEFAEIADDIPDELFNSSAGLKPVSIRLEEDLVENLKFFAEMEGVGYQPLIRRILKRWTRHELKTYKKYRPEDLQATELPQRKAG